MRILHTSDWHIGKQLYSKKRYQEFTLFLDWMAETIKDEKIDILLISGDVFDTTTPSNRAVELYFNFLNRIATDKVCKHIVITAGNHDSPSFLEAPKEILKFLNIHVVANIGDIQREVFKLSVAKEDIIISAVPYLRDRDLRESVMGETIEEKEHKIIYAITKHYKEVAEYAQKIQQKNEPIIAMGHLFVRGDSTKIGDGVRELYVGSLANVGVDIFDDCFDYVALGHLHIPQNVGGKENIRYSGSPLAMGFGEAKQQKSVTILDFKDKLEISKLNVPIFQYLKQIKGDLEEIKSELEKLIELKQSVWVEISYDGNEIVGNLPSIVDDIVKDSEVEVLRIKNRNFNTKTLQQTKKVQSLEELNVYEVFDKCLDYYKVQENQKTELKELYNEIVTKIQEDDKRAE